jgi:aflatoxin B1 aldehyde reductase
MGEAGKNGARMSDVRECQELLDSFFKYGKEIDTAREYGKGTTEQVPISLPTLGLCTYAMGIAFSAA